MNNDTELSVVIPVYNESGNLANLVKLWRQVFKKQDIQYQFIFLNDGSTDDSVQILHSLATGNSDIKIYSHSNSGHGPSIYKGYRLAVEAPWIFQIDADNQFETGAFIVMWNKRENFDFLLGQRSVVNASISRKILSVLSVLTVKLFTGYANHDLNTPYRLMRSQELVKALDLIPPRSFAPNILVTMFYLKNRKRIFVTALSYKGGTIARRSRMNVYFAKGALRSFFQILQFHSRL